MNNLKKIALQLFAFLFCAYAVSAQTPADWVNPFIGTTNYGTTNPGAVVPRGMVSVVPFNVSGISPLNKHDKDNGWWSTPYSWDNKYFTGYSHVNLSGVGCPELGVILLMPTIGEVDGDHRRPDALGAVDPLWGAPGEVTPGCGGQRHLHDAGRHDQDLLDIDQSVVDQAPARHLRADTSRPFRGIGQIDETVVGEFGMQRHVEQPAHHGADLR